MTYHIAIGRRAEGLEKTAVRILSERISERTRRRPNILDEQNIGDEPCIIVGTPYSSDRIQQEIVNGNLVLQDTMGPEGYVIQPQLWTNHILVAANSARGLLYGLGRLLRDSQFDMEQWVPRMQSVRSSPSKPVRIIYFATHFGNWYYNAPLEEVKTYIEDLALWGYNELMLFLDISHYRDMEDAADLVARLSAFDEFAHAVGMKSGRIGIANEGFRGVVGQGRPMLEKNAYEEDRSPLRSRDRIFGGYDTDICPSKEQGLELILHNRRQYLQKVQAFDTFWLWPYDQGGCNCPECSPWPKTFMELNKKLLALLKETHPHAEVAVSSWWIGTHVEGEDEAFFAELDKQESWFRYIVAGANEIKRWKKSGRTIPDCYSLVLFPEISMFDALPWGGKGANPAPRKFAGELHELGSMLAGAAPYSEGRYEDINKIIWAQLLWDPERTAQSIVNEYCRYYFGSRLASEITALVMEMENISEENPLSVNMDKQAAAIEHNMESGVRLSWRWEILRARTFMQRLGYELLHLQLTPDERKGMLEELRQAYEHLQFELYRHNPENTLDIWLYTPFEKRFAAITGAVEDAGKFSKGMFSE